MSYDYSDFKDVEKVGDNLMSQLKATAIDQVNAEANVLRLEEELKDEKAKVRDISERILPELMDLVGLGEFKTDDGIKITVKEEVFGGITKDNEAEAHAWLNENGNGNLIKRQFVIDFGKDEEAWANKFEGDLKKRKKSVNATIKRAVNYQTFKAFVRSSLADGVELPMKTLGVFVKKVSRVKLT